MIHVNAEFPIPLSFNLAFYSVDHAITNHSGIFLKHYMLDSEPQTGTLLPAMRVVSGPDSDLYYGVWHQQPLIIDARTQKASLWKPSGSHVPALSWPAGVAYDTKRDRALLVSLGGEGFLYAYTSGNHSWKLLASMQNRDVQALVYQPAEDAIYALASFEPVLYRFTADGIYTGSIALPRRPAGPDGAFHNELVAVGRSVLWISEADRTTMQPGRIVESFVYAIDPSKGSVRLAFVGAIVNSSALNKALASDVSSSSASDVGEEPEVALSIRREGSDSLLLGGSAVNGLE